MDDYNYMPLYDANGRKSCFTIVYYIVEEQQATWDQIYATLSIYQSVLNI